MSFVRCFCVNDTNRPKEIPADKWVKFGEEYRILGLYRHLKQNGIQGVTLMEKPLDETCLPYLMFRLSRFAIKLEDFALLVQLCIDTMELNEMNEADLKQLEELIKEEVEILQD